MKIEPHPLSQIFPMMDSGDRANLKRSLIENGQMEAVVLHEEKILDGRNRYEVLLELGEEPEFVEWSALSFQQRGTSPVHFVLARNFERRHLSPSQKAAVAAELLPDFEKAASERQAAKLKQNRPSPPIGGNGDSESNQDTGADPASESQERGTAAAAAAKATGASERSVQRAKALKQKDPKAFDEVKAGKTTLTAAGRNEQKAKAAAIETAFRRIAAVCGDAFALEAKRGEILAKRGDLLAFAAMDDGDMLKCSGLVKNGWTVARAKKYRMTRLDPTHSIRDLCLRASAKGGSFVLEGVAVGGATYRISVEREDSTAAISHPEQSATTIKNGGQNHE